MVEFEKQTFLKNFNSMLKVDSRRIFRTPPFYLVFGICLLLPVIILVMVQMMAGAATVDPNTGAESAVEGFSSVWQIISTVASAAANNESAAAGMDMTAMVNMNMVFFFIAVFVCLFVGGEYKSGYVKNLFTVRANKGDYVASKTLVCSIAGMIMVLAFFVGAMIGGRVAGLPYSMDGFNAANVIACVLAKMFLVPIFVTIPLALASFAKSRVWLSVILSLVVGMFLFMMIPMMTPLNASWQPFMCLAGSAIFGIGIGAVSNIILKKTSVV